MGYAKLFSELVTSTIWCEDDQTRIVWITMLSQADKNGEVMASVPGLARLANVPVDATRKAIQILLSPDPDSRTPDDEGRRIQPIDGGWILLNYQKYREKASSSDRAEKARIRQQRWREKQERNVASDVTERDATRTTPGATKADTKAADIAGTILLALPEAHRTDQRLPLALREYVEYRRERGKPITKLAATRLASKLAEHDPAEAGAALQTSVDRGWTGVFFDGDDAKAAGAHTAQPTLGDWGY
jgi:hypothetical protein